MPRTGFAVEGPAEELSRRCGEAVEKLRGTAAKVTPDGVSTAARQQVDIDGKAYGHAKGREGKEKEPEWPPGFCERRGDPAAKGSK